MVNQWRHVSTKDNPADYISRGMTAMKFHDAKDWFNGPEFLYGVETSWNQKAKVNTTALEKKLQKTILVLEKSNQVITLINHKNSFVTLKRVKTYMLRFVRNTRTKQDSRATNELSPSELNDASRVIIRDVQQRYFNHEINQLKLQQPLRTKHQ